MKKQLFLSLFLFVITSLLWAQTDMTDRIVNPGFEDGVEGWYIRKVGRQTNDAFGLKEGTAYVESWRPAGDKAQDGSLEQVLTKLPAGTYTVTVAAQNIQQNTPDVVQTGVWVYANENKTEVGLPGEYSVTATTVDGTLEIGFLIKGATGNYVCVDNFRLTHEEPTEETYAVFREEMGKLLAEAEKIDEQLSTPEQKALNEAVATAKAILAQSSWEGIIEAYTALDNAIFNYRFSLASPDKPMDVTSYMTNPGFEDSTVGWINGGFNSQNNDAFGLKVGDYYCEFWGLVTDTDIHQDVELPNGDYRLTMVGQNIDQGNVNVPQQGAYVYANNVEKLVNVPGIYSLDFVVVDNKAQIGLYTRNCTGNYVCLDDFHLYYVGFDETAQKETLQQLINEGEALMVSHQHKDSLAALTKAVKDAKEVTEVKEIAACALALTTAIKASETSVADYKVLEGAIKEAEVLANEGVGSNGATEFQQAIDEAKSVYNTAVALKAEIDLMVKELAQSGVLYCAANPSGEVPIVKTYDFIPRGATGALGRLTVTGLKENDLKYQGFCWATHKNPTLSDDYVAEGEQLFDYPGLIYIMEPLQPATVYYVRAFAMTKDNAVGYGEVRKIITLPMGQCTWSYANNGEAADNERLNAACAGAMDYYNNWTSIQGYHISVSYDAGDGSAHGSYGGWITVGPNAGYQRIGTLMHEANHGIGVGQHWRWGWEELKASTKWQGLRPTKTPKIEPGIWWQGDQANLVVDFLTNGQDLCNGDGAHMGPFGINGSGTEFRLLYIANALQTQGLGEDGLPPTGGSPTPYYTIESEDTTKYYITNEDEAYGRATAYLTETSDGQLVYRTISSVEVVEDDAFAWHLIFQPQTCYYLLRNAKSGKYFTFRSGSIRTAEVAEPAGQESFHLMRGRVPVILGAGDQTVNTKGYWICEGKRNVETPPALQANGEGGTITVANQDFTNSATSQRWVFLTADQVRLADEGKIAVDKEKLRRYVAGAKEMSKVPHHDVSSDASASFTSLVNKTEASIDHLTSAAEVVSSIDAMYAGITTFMVGTALDGMSAYDLTFLIDNAGMESFEGWTCEQSDDLNFTNGVCEVASTFDLYQTLSQMPKGVYSAVVQGFERPGAYSQVGKDYMSGEDNVSAIVYLYNKSSKLQNIMAGGQKRKLGTASQVYTQGLYIPNNVASAVDYMEQQLYENKVVVEVKRDTDIKLGLKNNNSVSSDWTVFDNFKLSYYGTDVTVDDVTGIDGVEQEPDAGIRQGIYDLSGRAIANPTRPGIYIVNGKKVVIH